MTDEEIEALKADPDALVNKLKETTGALQKTNAEKEEIAKKLTESEKNREFQAQNFKKFRDMTAEEKELLSEKEKELLIRQEKLEEEREKDKQEREKWQTDQIKKIENRFVKQLSGGDEKVAEKILFHYNRLSDKADDEETIEQKMNDAYRLLGDDRPDPLRRAISGRGSAPDVKAKSSDFSETDEGKGLGGALGLTLETPKK